LDKYARRSKFLRARQFQRSPIVTNVDRAACVDFKQFKWILTKRMVYLRAKRLGVTKFESSHHVGKRQLFSRSFLKFLEIP